MSRYKRKKWLRRISKIGAVLLVLIVVLGGLCWKTSTAKARQAVEDKGLKNVTLVSKVPVPMLVPGSPCGLFDYAGFTFKGVDTATGQKKTIEVCGNPNRIGTVTVK